MCLFLRVSEWARERKRERERENFLCTCPKTHRFLAIFAPWLYRQVLHAEVNARVEARLEDLTRQQTSSTDLFLRSPASILNDCSLKGVQCLPKALCIRTERTARLLALLKLWLCTSFCFIWENAHRISVTTQVLERGCNWFLAEQYQWIPRACSAFD